MIHDEYYTPEVSFSYRTPPATNQPELLMISIPRSSYTNPQLDDTNAEQGEEEALDQSQRESILTSTSTSSILTSCNSILTSSSILTSTSGKTEPSSLL